MKNNDIIKLVLFLYIVIYGNTKLIAAEEPDTYTGNKKSHTEYAYNRASSHVFIKKGTWMTGLTVTHGQYDSDNVELMSFIKNFDCNANIFAIEPFVGYFIRDNMSVGVRLGCQNVYASLNNLDINIDESLSLSLKEMSFEETLYQTAFFHRSYVGLDRGRRFGLFNETCLSLNFGNSRYIRGNEEKKDTKSRIREINITLNPGMSVFVLENLSAEVSFAIAGFNYRQENQTLNGVSSGWRKSSGANFKINLLNVSIGLVAYI